MVSTGIRLRLLCCARLRRSARLKVNQDDATAWLRERGARWFYVLAPEPGPKPERREAVPGEDAVLWRRRSGHGFGGRMRDRLPCRLAAQSDRTRGFTCAREWRWAGRAIFFSPRQKEFARVSDVRVAGQHCSCGKRTAFPAVMHMLSTEIHHRK